MSKHQVNHSLVPAAAILLGALVLTTRANAQVMPASASAPAPAQAAAADTEHLQVGDTYRVAIERQGVRRELEGVLAKANEKWIVLVTITGAQVERGEPIAPKVPYLNRLFRNVGVGRSQQTHWLPREAVTIQSRSATNNKVELQLPQPESPPSDAGYLVELMHDGKQVSRTARFTFAEQYLVAHHQIHEARVRGVPFFSDIPIIGQAFRKESTSVHEVEEQFSWNEVLCITPRELPANPEK